MLHFFVVYIAEKLYLEICIDDIEFKRGFTSTSLTISLNLGSLRAFIFDPTGCKFDRHHVEEKLECSNQEVFSKDIQQIMFISGKDNRNDNEIAKSYLLKAVLQFPLQPPNQHHPAVLYFILEEVNVCIDPLLCQWLLYAPSFYPHKSDLFSGKVF